MPITSISLILISTKPPNSLSSAIHPDLDAQLVSFYSHKVTQFTLHNLSTIEDRLPADEPPWFPSRGLASARTRADGEPWEFSLLLASELSYTECQKKIRTIYANHAPLVAKKQKKEKRLGGRHESLLTTCL